MNCSKAKNLDSFYKSRALFLYKYAKVKNDRIECSDYLGELFSKLLQSHYSVRENIHCKQCTGSNSYNRTSLKIFLNKGVVINNMEKEIDDSLPNKKYCKECCNTVSVSYEFGSYMALDLEHAEYSIFLNTIPKELIVRNVKYILTGLISYECKEKRSYIAYCKKIKDSWTKLQSTKRKAEDVRKIPNVDVAIIFYVKIN